MCIKINNFLSLRSVEKFQTSEVIMNSPKCLKTAARCGELVTTRRYLDKLKLNPSKGKLIPLNLMLQGKNSRNFGESSVGNLFRSGRTFKLLGSR